MSFDLLHSQPLNWATYQITYINCQIKPGVLLGSNALNVSLRKEMRRLKAEEEEEKHFRKGEVRASERERGDNVVQQGCQRNTFF